MGDLDFSMFFQVWKSKSTTSVWMQNPSQANPIIVSTPPQLHPLKKGFSFLHKHTQQQQMKNINNT